jgi:hypothetical protein
MHSWSCCATLVSPQRNLCLLQTLLSFARQQLCFCALDHQLSPIGLLTELSVIPLHSPKNLCSARCLACLFRTFRTDPRATQLESCCKTASKFLLQSKTRCRSRSTS